MKNELELYEAQKLLDAINLALKKNPDKIPHLIDDPKKGNYGEILSHLVYLLTNVSLDPENAKSLLEETFQVRLRMSECMGREVDFRVALLDLIIQRKELIRDPKLIEIKLYLEQERKAVVDYLTGLYNRSYYEEAMDREINQARRYNREFSLVLIDIDNFKVINDTYGHSIGDEVLKILSDILKSNIRKEDTACRTGGEEFVLILPDTKSEGAFKVAEKIRESFFKESIRSSSLSFSAGIAGYPKDADNKKELFELADKAMYYSKYTGKNRVNLVGSIKQSGKDS